MPTAAFYGFVAATAQAARTPTLSAAMGGAAVAALAVLGDLRLLV